MAVPLLDPRLELAPLAGALRAAFERVLASGQFILGPEVEAFEREVAGLAGANYALGVSSGTDALVLALMAQDIGRGDEVICPTYTFFATAGSIWRCGARPVFVDVCAGCLNLLPEAVAAAITPKTRAIMPVHLFGQCAHMREVVRIAEQARVNIIEDAAQALGATDDKAAAGGMGRVGCFSFFPSKNLGALGDAGLVVTSEEVLWHRLKSLRVHGASRRYHHAQVGGNFRMDALQGAFLRTKLPHLAAAVARRRAHAALFADIFAAHGLARAAVCACREGRPSRPPAIAEDEILLPANPTGEHVFNQFVVRFADHACRERVRQALLARDMGCAIYYPVPLHRQECFALLPGARDHLPVAEHAAATSLALPIAPHLDAGQVTQVAETVVAAVSGRRRALSRPA